MPAGAGGGCLWLIRLHLHVDHIAQKVQPHLLTLVVWWGGGQRGAAVLIFLILIPGFSKTTFVTAGESPAPGGTAFCEGTVCSGALKGSLQDSRSVTRD